MGLAFFLRVYFVYNLFAPAGIWSGKGDYSGGSDPFYWERALLYSFTTGKEIGRDMAMNYPLGFPDVRPPLFDWFNLLVGYLISPVFGNAWNAMVWMLNMNAAILGALTIIPTYLLGKEAFNRRAGLIGAFLLAISAAALQRSHATIGVHDSWTLFFVVCAFYFYLRSLKTLRRGRWVENWLSLRSIRTGLATFRRDNRTSLLYAGLAGLSVSVTALSWQGWAYVPVILVLTFLVEVILDRIRNDDVMGVTILYVIITATPLLLSFPWYYVRGQIPTWWDVPFYLFLVTMALGVVFSVTRDYPWAIIIPAVFVAGAGALLVGFTVNPSLLNAFVSGAGYFVKTKVYQTIAEAQEPGMSELVLSFGWFTFYIGLGAIAYMIWQIPRRNNPAFTMLVLWAFGSLFMAVSAARFIFNAAPIFAVATAYAVDQILSAMDFEGMRRTYRSLKGGSWRNAVRKSLKPRHVITVVLIAFLVLLPNVWFAVDSAIPYELKPQYDKEVYNLLPSFLRAPGYSQTSGGTFYFGAFGYSLPTATQYFPASYAWLDTQDTNVPLEQRPAVTAWWDYGFEITERGGHPVVADPFQNGYVPAGQFLLAQNESAAVAIWEIRLLEGSWTSNHPSFSSGVNAALQSFGLDPAYMSYAFNARSVLVPTIQNNPLVYGYWDASIQSLNVPYVFLVPYITSHLGLERIVELYETLREATGSKIGYYMVDTRLFPVSASNTGIFYAPVKLTDGRVLTLPNGQALPYDYFQIFANTAGGATHLPVQDLGPADQVTSTSIEYQPAFYKSMFYRAFVGYTPTDLGYPSDLGVPGIDTTLQSIAPNPAWNLTHFRVVYRTAYYNPFPDPSNHTAAWQAVSATQAQQLQTEISAGKVKGVVDASTQGTIANGAIILRYYDGAFVNGTVTLDGKPVPNVWITVTDELGTPHNLTKTDANGRYSVLAPFGNITLTASAGNLSRPTLVGSQVLYTTTFPVSQAQADRLNQDLDGDGIVDWKITKDINLGGQPLSGTVFFDLDYNLRFSPGDIPITGTNVTFTLPGIGAIFTTRTDSLGHYSLRALPTGAYTVLTSYQGHNLTIPNVAISTSTSTKDLLVPFASLVGTAADANGNGLGGTNVTITDSANGTSWTVAASALGAYAVRPLFQGAYVVEAAQAGLATMPQQVLLGPGASQSLNLTLGPSGTVQATTRVFGTLQPHATLSFESIANPSLIRTVTSDASGSVTVRLPAGDWEVNGRLYIGTSLYATLGRVTVLPGASASFAATFVDGARVNGTVTSSGGAISGRPTIGFLGPAGEWFLVASPANAYVAFLPTGTYQVEAMTASAAFFGSVRASGPTILNLPLANATSLSGSVYWDKNGDGQMESGEQVAGAEFDLTDSSGNRVVVFADDTGSFRITGFDSRTYGGTLRAFGFNPWTINATTLAGIGLNTRFALAPTPIEVQGSVLLNGTPLVNHPVKIEALPGLGSARPANTTTDSLGGFAFSLAPGSYRFVVDENVSSTSNLMRYQDLAPDFVTLDLGEGALARDLTIVSRVLVQGNVTLGGVAGPDALVFVGMDHVTLNATAAGFLVYLRPGTYSVSANRTNAGVNYAILTNLTVPHSGNVTLALQVATQVAGQALYGGTPLAARVDVTFARKEGGTFRTTSSTGGGYAASLVGGNYTVTVNSAVSQTDGSVVRYFIYQYQGTLSVISGTPSVAFDLTLTRTYDNTTVAGVVSFAGGGADASLSFFASGGGAINATVGVPTSGAYSVPLTPGTYDVYAVRPTGENAYLASLVVAHAPSLSYDIALAPASRLSGVVTDVAGVPVQSALTIQSLAIGGAELAGSTDAGGGYSFLLPQGDYGITATRTGSERGIPVTYTVTANVTLTTDLIANLGLQKVVSRSLVLTWDPNQQATVAPGGSVTYTITIGNSGNVADTYAFAGSPSNWHFTFQPSTVPLNFGSTGNTTSVRVTIQTTPDALVDHAPIYAFATSTAHPSVTGQVTLSLGIGRIRGLSLQIVASSGTFDGTYLNYTVNLRNSGNGAESVQVGIANPGDVAASGWIPMIAKPPGAPSSGILSNVSVPANATIGLKLSLKVAGAAGGATVVLQAMAEDDPAVAAQTIYTVAPPGIEVTAGPTASGPGIAMSVAQDTELYAIAIGALAAAGAGVFVTRKRR